MNSTTILQVLRLPARLTIEQTAELLGFMSHDIPLLVRARLLKPLGNAAVNAPKFFAAAEVARCAGDSQWLHKATKTVSDHWRHKNGRRQDCTESVSSTR